MIPVIKSDKDKELDLLLYGEISSSWIYKGFKVSAIPRHAYVPGVRVIYTGGKVPIIINK